MLNPNDRSLYTEALTPPPGLELRDAIAATFSLDPTTLLTVPTHLALLDTGTDRSTLDGIAVFESLRRHASRITVYSQVGRFKVPDASHCLYGMLDTMVVEVAAPQAGVFHPKFWLMTFEDPESSSVEVIRLVVLSRNLTADRSWDVALCLDGKIGKRKRSENKALAELISALPTLAVDGLLPVRIRQADSMSDQVSRAAWELPPGFDTISFSVLGLTAKAWSPPSSRRLVVVSPFLSPQAVRSLAATTDSPEALISRPDALSEMDEESLCAFEQCFVLDESIETEDGEDVISLQDTLGLHAKLYVLERGWDTHVVMGSANATSAALLNASNIEVLVELVGKRSRVGGIDQLLGEDGFGRHLSEFFAEDSGTTEEDLEQKEAERLLDEARDSLVRAEMRLSCNRDVDTDTWTTTLSAALPQLKGIKNVRVWPITLGEALGVLVPLQREAVNVDLGKVSVESLTGLIAFELRTVVSNHCLRFVRNLPVDGLPANRDSAILHSVLHDREGFLRYLLLLLGDLASAAVGTESGKRGKSQRWSTSGSHGLPLMEDLVRAYSRDLSRLKDVDEVVRILANRTDSEGLIVPEEFLALWSVFEAALGDGHAPA